MEQRDAEDEGQGEREQPSVLPDEGSAARMGEDDGGARECAETEPEQGASPRRMPRLQRVAPPSHRMRLAK